MEQEQAVLALEKEDVFAVCRQVLVKALFTKSYFIAKSVIDAVAL